MITFLNFVTKVFSATELASFTPCRRGKIFERCIVPLPAHIVHALSPVDNGDESSSGGVSHLGASLAGHSLSPVLGMAALVLGEVFDKIFSIQDGAWLLVEDLVKVRKLCSSSHSSTAKYSSH
jgi:hypothetical protein